MNQLRKAPEHLQPLFWRILYPQRMEPPVYITSLQGRAKTWRSRRMGEPPTHICMSNWTGVYLFPIDAEGNLSRDPVATWWRQGHTVEGFVIWEQVNPAGCGWLEQAYADWEANA